MWRAESSYPKRRGRRTVTLRDAHTLMLIDDCSTLFLYSFQPLSVILIRQDVSERRFIGSLSFLPLFSRSVQFDSVGFIDINYSSVCKVLEWNNTSLKRLKQSRVGGEMSGKWDDFNTQITGVTWGWKWVGWWQSCISWGRCVQWDDPYVGKHELDFKPSQWSLSRTSSSLLQWLDGICPNFCIILRLFGQDSQLLNSSFLDLNSWLFLVKFCRFVFFYCAFN